MMMAGMIVMTTRGMMAAKARAITTAGAAMAATGAVSVFHVEGITPEARIFQFSPEGLDQVIIEEQEVEALFSDIDIDGKTGHDI